VKDRVGQVWSVKDRLYLIVKPGLPDMDCEGRMASHQALSLIDGRVWLLQEEDRQPFELSDGWERLA